MVHFGDDGEASSSTKVKNNEKVNICLYTYVCVYVYTYICIYVKANHTY
jgi:hypothetical protein